jgi:hypothetical protein
MNVKLHHAHRLRPLGFPSRQSLVMPLDGALRGLRRELDQQDN